VPKGTAFGVSVSTSDEKFGSESAGDRGQVA